MESNKVNQLEVEASGIIYPEGKFTDYDGLEWTSNGIYKYDPSKMPLNY